VSNCPLSKTATVRAVRARGRVRLAPEAVTAIDERSFAPVVNQVIRNGVKRRGGAPRSRPAGGDYRRPGVRGSRIVPTFGATPLTKIERSDVAAWIVELVEAGLAGPTVRRAHRLLHIILTAAVDDGRLSAPPRPGPAASDRRREKRFLTHAEVSALADAAEPDGLAILVSAFCGLRFGELAALRVRNVDPPAPTPADRGIGHRGGKRHGLRYTEVPPLPFGTDSRSLVDDLAPACAGKSPDDLVFTAPRGGVIMQRNWRRRIVDPALERAGLGDLTPHEFRHTAGHSLAVADRLGTAARTGWSGRSADLPFHPDAGPTNMVDTTAGPHRKMMTP
jgi:integrase